MYEVISLKIKLYIMFKIIKGEILDIFNTVFENILDKENNVSQILCNLMNYKIVKKVVFDFFEIYGDINTYEINVEVNLKNKQKSFGRIDILISNDENEYLIENKIYRYTKLTENQPNNYIDYINTTKENGKVNKKLLFIIPKYFYHENELNKVDKKNIKYWEDLLNLFVNSGLTEINPLINSFVKYMNNIVEIKNITFTKNEIELIKSKGVAMNDKRIPTIIKKLIEIVEGVKEKLKLKIENKNNPNKYVGGYGYSISLDDLEVFIWFGIEYNIWEETGNPIILWIEDFNDIQKKELLKIGLESYYDEDTEFLIYKFDTNTDNIIEIIIEKIFDVIEKINKIKT